MPYLESELKENLATELEEQDFVFNCTRNQNYPELGGRLTHFTRPHDPKKFGWLKNLSHKSAPDNIECCQFCKHESGCPIFHKELRPEQVDHFVATICSTYYYKGDDI